MEIVNKLRNLDAYPKVNEDFYSRTLSGGVITIVSSIVMIFLFLSELSLYLNAVTETKLTVDSSRGETLRINIERPLQRHGGRLDHNETYCGSCYGAEVSDDECCNSCEEVSEAYRKKGWGMTNPDLIDQCKREGFIQKIKDEEGEGCNIHGFLEVNKVAGSVRFAPGNIHLNDLLAFQTESNISHKINKVSFGEEFPGVVNPLDGVQWTQQTLSGMYQYFIKVVPTIYTDIIGRKIQSNQFSVTEHFRVADGYPRPLPGIFLFYDFSPIKVIFTEENVSFLHFLTNICAIVGGVFTVSGIVDAFVYHGHRAIKKKMEIGKYG
ncbi:uncharacterized protein LOC143888417 isoform X3 [Tasmannia lanceolata]|uniref:uncharacterized protein LOC143888417 isoform X3 n=1 Tax=Tasmannia lanceolata TaxID=3420 RepID=UPI0040635274